MKAFEQFWKMARKPLPVDLANGNVPRFNAAIDKQVQKAELFFSLMNPGRWCKIRLEGKEAKLRATTITVNSAEYDEWFVRGFLKVGNNEVEVQGLVSTQEKPDAGNWGYLQYPAR